MFGRGSERADRKGRGTLEPFAYCSEGREFNATDGGGGTERKNPGGKKQVVGEAVGNEKAKGGSDQRDTSGRRAHEKRGGGRDEGRKGTVTI